MMHCDITAANCGTVSIQICRNVATCSGSVVWCLIRSFKFKHVLIPSVLSWHCVTCSWELLDDKWTIKMCCWNQVVSLHYWQPISLPVIWSPQLSHNALCGSFSTVWVQECLRNKPISICSAGCHAVGRFFFPPGESLRLKVVSSGCRELVGCHAGSTEESVHLNMKWFLWRAQHHSWLRSLQTTMSMNQSEEEEEVLILSNAWLSFLCRNVLLTSKIWKTFRWWMFRSRNCLIYIIFVSVYI